MRVLMLAWEYPPLVVGGLGRHVEGLAGALVRTGLDVHVVTRGDRPATTREVRDGVHVTRAALDPLAIDFTTESLLAWSQAAEHALLRAALPLVAAWRPDVVHAHDWLVAQTATTLCETATVPLVVTVHATEHGRHHGRLPSPLSRAIDSLERWLVERATAVITCAPAMRDEVVAQFDRPGVHVVANGIDPRRWPLRPTAVPNLPPVLVFAGRLVHEKGVQTLLTALRPLRDQHPGLRLVVAGAGPYEDELRALARRLRVARAVEWHGFVAEDALAALLASADAAVVPSLYEPFGIVALEAAAVGTPLVVADTGGLADLARRGVAASRFAPCDATGLAVAVAKVLADRGTSMHDARQAARVVRRQYGWTAVARQTAAIYSRAASGL